MTKTKLPPSLRITLTAGLLTCGCLDLVSKEPATAGDAAVDTTPVKPTAGGGGGGQGTGGSGGTAAATDTSTADAVVADAKAETAPPAPPDAPVSGSSDVASIETGQLNDGSADATASADSACLSPAVVGLECGCKGNGKVLCDGTCSQPDAACVPEGQFYFLTNVFLGDSRRLDTYGTTPFAAFSATTLGTTGQFWNITALGDGYYRLTNMFLGAARSLEASADGTKLVMGATTDATAQKWRIRAAGNTASGNRFRITNALVGESRSLDVRTDGANAPFLNTTANYSGEFWKITKAP
jgi:hypothetical protein